MKKQVLRIGLGAALALVIVLSLLSAEAYPQRCWGFRNSQPTVYAGDVYCLGTGGGCTECYNLDGAWCVMSGYGFNYICDPFDHDVVIPLY